MKYLLMLLVAFVGSAIGQQISDTYTFGALVGIALLSINQAIGRSSFSCKDRRRA